MGLFVGALVRSDKRLERPDLQINMFAWATKERTRAGVVPQPFSSFGLSPVHLRPDGRGTVRLKAPTRWRRRRSDSISSRAPTISRR